MKITTLFAALAMCITPAALATAHHNAAKQPATASAPLSEGEVRKVDVDARKITLKHGPIANLDMPAMSMVFTVKDPAMLQKVKQGDKVRFSADKIDGVFTLTQIETAK